MSWTRPLDAIDLGLVHHQGPGSRPMTLAELDADHRAKWPGHPLPGPSYHRVVHLLEGEWVLTATRSLTSIGWHAGARVRPGWSRVNTRSVGVCLLAPLEHAQADPRAWELLVLAWATLVRQVPGLTVERIHGHGHVAGTGCPGTIDLPRLRHDVGALLEREARVERASRGVAALYPVHPTT